MIRVSHVITGLGAGGAEAMLLKIVESCRRREIESHVISLTDRGVMAARLEEAGATVSAVGLSRSPLAVPAAVFSMRRRLRSLKPDIVQTWMYHADLIGGLGAKLAGVPAVLWNVRQSNLRGGMNRRSTILTMSLCARLSASVPKRIITNSSAAVASHRDIGYESSRFVVIPNGFDTIRFRENPGHRSSVRQELGIGTDRIVVGCVARWDPQKDVKGLVQASARVLKMRPDVEIVICGRELDESNRVLTGWVSESGLGDRFHLLGHRDDIDRIIPSFDIAVSSSVGEGFANTIGEAMSCAVSCVVTDVGDSAYVVSDTGIVVPPGDPEALAKGIATLVDSSEMRAALGARARERIEREFSIDAVAGRYVEVWKEALTCAA